MKKNLFRKVLCFILSVTTLFGAVGVTAAAGPLKGENSTSATLEEMQALVDTKSYAAYKQQYAHVVNKEGLPSISVDVLNFEGNAVIVDSSLEKFEGINNPKDPAWTEFGKENEGTSVYLPSEGSVTWQFAINDKDLAGLYNLKIVYYNCSTDEISISSI